MFSRRWMGVGVACAGLAGGQMEAGALPWEGGVKERRPAVGAEVFNGTRVLRIQIEVAPADVEILRGSTRSTPWGGLAERPTVKATVKEGGLVFTNVALHLKGAAGSFRPVDDDPCFTLNFQKFAPGQTFHGLHKISLNNSVQDPSFLTEKICRELFAAAGVPVARAGHATVRFNGRELGLHVLTEAYNRQFLQRYYKNTKGNLYDGGFLHDITDALEVNAGEAPTNHTALKALAEVAEAIGPTNSLVPLAKVLDLDCFLSFLAMDLIECDWDGYAMNRNNWRIFHDREANQMVFFPHGLDQMFGVARTTPECPILPRNRIRGLVARAVLFNQEGQRRYLERMNVLYANVFKADAILKRVDALATVLRPAIAEAGPGTAGDFDQEVKWLKERITQRAASLKTQLAEAAAGKLKTEDDEYWR